MIAQRFVFTRGFLTEWNTVCLSAARELSVVIRIKRGIVILVRNAGLASGCENFLFAGKMQLLESLHVDPDNTSNDD